MRNQESATNGAQLRRSARAARRALSRDLYALAADLLPLFDFVCLLLAGYLSSVLHQAWFGAANAAGSLIALSMVAAMLAPLMLCDRSFALSASRGETGALVRCFATRFLIFVGAVLAVGYASRSLGQLPHTWAAMWLVSSLALTAGARILLSSHLRQLERTGFLTEVIAVVGAGPVADRFVQELRRNHAGRVELLGVFDDQARSKTGSRMPDGSISELIELGKGCKIDWIVLTVPGTEEERLLSMVHRLKALSTPIALCPQGVGLLPPSASIAYVANGMPVALLHDGADRSSRQREVENLLPRWILTLWALPGVLLEVAASALRFSAARRQSERLSCELDDCDLDHFVATARNFGRGRYGYVVTPNVDHLIRLHKDAQFRELYRDASYVLLDSRFLSKLLRFTQRLELPVCTGSDLTARLFAEVIGPQDPLVVIGGTEQQARMLQEKYGLSRLAHFNPPMGFIRDPAAVEECLQFIETHSPFRFCLLAVGAPQQEIIAQRLRQRGRARGLALCIGASINFLTGDEQRAPLWMQQMGIEWLFRLLQAPQRMAGRYLVRGPRIFTLLRKTEFVLRPAAASAPVEAPAPANAASFRDLTGFEYSPPSGPPQGEPSPPAPVDQPTPETGESPRRMPPPSWRARPRTPRSPSTR